MSSIIKLFLFCVFLSFPITSSERIEEKEMTIFLEEVVIQPENYELVILETLWENGVSIDLSYIILAQAKHESANFTSRIFEEGWNPFGMKCPNKRKTTCIGSVRGHAKYESISDATLDYIYYMKARKIPYHEKNIKKYLSLLHKKGYFEDGFDNYYNSVKKHKKKIDNV